MGTVLPLEGCMAVGKTAALRELERMNTGIAVFHEDKAATFTKVKALGVNTDAPEGFAAMQRLFIRDEMARFTRAAACDLALMDFGPEEVEFHTLFYPESIGADWDAELLLENELRVLRAHMPRRVLFLNARDETLRARKQGDSTRSRNSFEHHLQYMMPLKRAWFEGRADTDFLQVDDMTPRQMAQAIAAWAEKWK